MYAIVDIETTGSNTAYDRIIEVAVVTTDGKEILSSFQTLINPGISIPYWISGLTGIEPDDVREAPSFSEICEHLKAMLADKIFVAHNVGFDYGFLKSEFAREDIDFNPKRTCSVRLSRKIIPGYRSYSLGSLCADLNIPIEGRHRAMGDAQATTLLFHKLYSIDKESIDKSVKRNSGEAVLPPNLPRTTFDRIPELPGIYYFHDEHQKVIYVGKADNIRKRVKGHFSAGSESRQKQRLFSSICDISYELCGNELISLLLEIAEIKRLWPAYNKEAKKPGYTYGVYIYEDPSGYLRLSIGKMQVSMKPVSSFRSYLEAREYLIAIADQYKLCERKCGIRKDSCPLCHEYCRNTDPENYNNKVMEAINGTQQGKNLIIKGMGRNTEEFSLVVVENGVLLGYGFVDKELCISSPDEAKLHIRRLSDNPESQKTLTRWLKKEKPSNIIYY